MCGIYGKLNKNGLNRTMLESISNSIGHRGPDYSGHFENDNLYLGHKRLSIIDLSSDANQPMKSIDENYIIVYNGELYNYKEIKQQLITLQFKFRTNSDTEVILVAYQAWGTKAFEHFNGMFAFVIYDKKNNKIILVRDHIGIKPLYYSILDDRLLFCSEMRGFKAYNTNWQSSDNWEVFFLSMGFIPSPYTTLKNVYSLKKGYYLQIDYNSGTQEFVRYNNFSFSNTIHEEKLALEMVRSTFIDAVKRNMISDAPLGIFLSGGIDSSLIAIIANSLGNKDLNTLSITFDELAFNEASYQKIILNKMHPHNHINCNINGNDFIEKLGDILNAIDQPSWDGVNTYFISSAAQKAGLKAVLSGLGGDELFGGYPTFNRTKILKFASNIPNFLLQLSKYFPNEKIARFAFLGSSYLLKDYLFLRGSFNHKDVSSITGFNTEVIKNIFMTYKIEDYPTVCDKNLISFLETNVYLENQLLKDTDYMSMWNSLEVRVPFLDKELMNLVNSISPSVKYNSQLPKYLLTKAFEDIIPKEIIFRKKQGFTFPMSIWLKKYIDVIKLLLPDTPISHKILDQFLAGQTHWSRLWSLIVYKRFLN